MDVPKAYWGYMLTAISIILQVLFIGLSLVLEFVSSPVLFFKSLIWNIIFISFVLAISGYGAWIAYCYAKLLTQGHRDLVESGRGEGLIAKEHGPGVPESSHPHGTENPSVNIEIKK